MELSLLKARDVLTMTGRQADAIVIFADRILAVGQFAELQAAHPTAKLRDFGDAVLLPGFIDPHMHPARAAEYQIHAHIDPDTVLKLDDFMRVMREKAAVTPKGKLVRGVRYDETRATGGRLVDRADLDRVSSDHPVLVTHFTGHIGIMNSAALEMFGISETTEPPVGGSYGRDATGQLNGQLFGAGIQALLPRFPELSMDEKLHGLSLLQEKLHAAGLTSVTDAIATPPIIRLFQEAERRGQLTLRIGLLLWHSFYDQAKALGIGLPSGSDRVRFLGVKALLDGVLSSATALVSEPYEGSEDCGKLVTSEEELFALVRKVHANGEQMAVHANGDRAIQILLAAYAKAQDEIPQPHLRHRIEHASLISPELLREIKRLEAMVVPIMSYIPYHGDKMRRHFGAARAERMVACRSFIDAGITMAGSSDYGACPFEPLYAMQAAVTRIDNEGRVLGGSQRITVEEALAMYTREAAVVNGEAHLKGTIAPGLLADLTVLAHDPRRVAPEEIAAIKVMSTWVGGREVWSAGDS